MTSTLQSEQRRPLKLDTRGTYEQKPHFDSTFAKKPEIGAPKTAKKPFQAHFWELRKIHTASVAAKLRSVQDTVRADALDRCHTEATHAECVDCKTHRVFMNRCDKFYCPFCQPSISKRRLKAVEWWAHQCRQPKHVILTVKNSTIVSRLGVDFIKSCWKSLRRSKFAKEVTSFLHTDPADPSFGKKITSYPWKGGFWTIEVTNEGKGWHVHIHALIESQFIDVEVLKNEWAKRLGQDIAIVKVKDARAKQFINEVTKYIVKGDQLSSWSGQDILNFINAFDGVRTFGAFGELHGKRTEFKSWLEQFDKDTTVCECCGGLVRFFTEWEWETAGGHAKDSCAQHNRPPPPLELFKPWEFQFR